MRADNERLNTELERVREKNRINYDAVINLSADNEQLRARVAELERIEELALIWSAYQDDDSKLEQIKDARLRAVADAAERSLYEALI